MTKIPDCLQILRDDEARCYLVRFVVGPERARVLVLFGTDTLPLPWNAEAGPEEVVNAVRRRNPEAEVLGP